MSQFSSIEYPQCPECGILINDLRIFNLSDMETQRFFHEKECPKCKKPFLMKVRTELTVEVVQVEKKTS